MARTDKQRVKDIRRLVDTLEKLPGELVKVSTNGIHPARFDAMQRTIDFTLHELRKALK